MPVKFLSSVGLICLIVIVAACRKEGFVPDPDDARLPKYTESGNMVGGALVNDVAWKTRWESKTQGEYKAFYFTNYPAGDSVTLDLQGIFIEGPNRDREFDFLLVFKGIQIRNVDDLKAFEGRTFALNGQNNYVVINDYTDGEFDVTPTYTGGIGTFSINAVKENSRITYYRGIGDNREPYHPVVIAGTFNFEFPSASLKVESGRYDFFISDSEVVQKE
jgi:hypothetical protein